MSKKYDAAWENAVTVLQECGRRSFPKAPMR